MAKDQTENVPTLLGKHGGIRGSAQAVRMASMAVLLVVAGMFCAAQARAEAYIAVREGYKCSQCHFNKTGGGKRNEFANVYVQTRLAQSFVQWQPRGDESGESAVANMYHGRLNDFVSLGADMRFAYSETRNPGTEDPEKDLSIRSGLLYLQMDMVPNRASLYLDQDVSGTSATRELFVLFDDLWLDGYAKLGRFFQASGYRLQDDNAFIRQFSGFTYGNPATGIELGFEPGPFSFNIWTTSIDEKRGLMGSWIARSGRLGLSYSKDSTIEGSKKTVANVFAGLHFGRFTGLFELDDIVTKTDTEVTSQALLLELDYMITKGANLKLVSETWDPDVDATTDRVDRVSLIYEPFLTQFLQVRIGIRDYTGQSNNDEENQQEVFLEIHAFFF
jgi:hypothetical protein